MTKLYKNIFDFVYSTLGYSPGGEYKNGTLTFHHRSIRSTEDLVKLDKAWIEYQEWFDKSEQSKDKKLPNVEFFVYFGPTFPEEMLEKGYSHNKIGDTNFWKKD